MEVDEITKKRIAEYLSQGKRFDKRELLEYRNLEIKTHISNQAEGSASVKLGNTEVIAGVKLDVGEPFRDHADEGVLMIAAELSPMASEKFELGPPKIEAIELSRIIDRGIRESGFIDFKKLCIREGELVWTVLLDIYPINDDGNLIDASAIAAIVALRTTVFPKLEEDKILYGEWTDKKLPLTEHMPLTLTFHKIGKSIILDPVTEEEEASEARLSIALSGKKQLIINALQKGNEAALSEGEIFEIIDLAEKEWPKLHDEIEEKLKKH